MNNKILPSLWFDDCAEEAMHFYASVFPHSKIDKIRYYPENAQNKHLQGKTGKVLHGQFEIGGYSMAAMDGGPLFPFNPSISFFVNFDPSREENAADHLQKIYKRLMEGGKALMELGEYPFSREYAWIEDKYGVSWQLILTNPTGEKRPFIMPSFMFNRENTNRAEEAIRFYTSLFEDSESGNLARYPEDTGPAQKGALMFGDFRIARHWFAIMDAGMEQDFSFNESISWIVRCKNQQEIDFLWEKLSAVPESEQCGWCKDKYGISWQIIPANMGELIGNSAALEAMMRMKKIKIKELENAGNHNTDRL